MLIGWSGQKMACPSDQTLGRPGQSCVGVVYDVSVLCSFCLCIGYVGAIPHRPSYIVVRHRRHERSGVIRGDHIAAGLAGVLDNIPNHIL